MSSLWGDSVPAAWRARAGDLGCILLALVIGGMATDSAELPGGSYAEVNLAIGLVAALALWWRRRWPVAVAALTFVAPAAAPMAAGASMLSVFTLAAHRRNLAPAVLGILAALYAGARTVALVVTPDDSIGSTLIGLLLMLTALGWGLAVRSRQELLVSLADRAERAESERDARVAAARRAERTRIAAEMHDVLAHRLSMLSLQAGAIELRPGAPPDQLAQAAGVVRDNAHLALEDLRAVIGVLRDDDLAPLTAGSAPPPTTTQLDVLLAECQSAGMRIEVAGEPLTSTSLPPSLAHHVYRIVQEGLTNARKHAPGQVVQVAVTGLDVYGVDVHISNPVAPTRPDPNGVIPGAGVGLVGLRERVELIGGTLERTMEGGTHRLQAWLPWPT